MLITVGKATGYGLWLPPPHTHTQTLFLGERTNHSVAHSSPGPLKK